MNIINITAFVTTNCLSVRRKPLPHETIVVTFFLLEANLFSELSRKSNEF